MRTFSIVEAIQSLCPGAEWTIPDLDYSKIIWHVEPENIPTLQELETEAQRLQTEYEALEYQRQRAKVYPNIGDQLDMLWHAIDSGTLNKTSDFYTTIKAVKDAYPKSE